MGGSGVRLRREVTGPMSMPSFFRRPFVMAFLIAIASSQLAHVFGRAWIFYAGSIVVLVLCGTDIRKMLDKKHGSS